MLNIKAREEQMNINEINPQMISVMYDDRCCGHCKYYDGNGYCVNGTPVRATDWCRDFKYA